MQALLLAVVGLSVSAPAAASGKGDAGSAPAKGREGNDALWAVLGNFDEYPGATPYQVADEMLVGQASLHMAGFVTSEPPEKISDFYRAQFMREKLFIPTEHPRGLPFSGITAYDPKGDVEKTVMVLPGSGGPTRVVLSISPGAGLMPKSLKAGGEPPAGLPVFPGSDDLYRTDAKDSSHLSSTVSYRAPADPGKVLEFVRKELSGKGWTQGNDQGEPGGGLIYVRGGEVVTITLLPMGGDGTEVTYVYQH